MKSKKWIKWILFSVAAATLFAAILFFGFAFKKDFTLSTKKGKIAVASFVLLLASIVLFTISLTMTVSIAFNEKNKLLEKRLDTWGDISFHVSQLSDEISEELPVGIMVTSSDGKCEWMNQAIKNIYKEDVRGKYIENLIPDFENRKNDNDKDFVIKIKNDQYEVTKKNNAYFFYNVTERENIKDKYNKRSPVIAFLSLDNLNEAITSLDVARQSATKGLYFAAISDWAVKYNCFIKTYSTEQMVIAAYKEELDEMIRNKFDILEKIRQISYDNNILVTLSMGVASWDLPIDEISLYAQNALELAEKRGGDQVVVNIQNEKILYFGAKIEQESTGSKVTARVKAESLKKMVDKASSVFVMGHINTDTDAYAGMLATYNMIKADGKSNVFMIMEKEKLDKTVFKIAEIVEKEYPQVVEGEVSTQEALDIIDKNSLLIVVDTQNKKLVSSPEVLKAISNIAIIDHHRATDNSFRGEFEYLEPTSSSTSELLVEIIEFYTNKKSKINSLVASVMYSGLLVDTNNFSYRTGVRTFEAASKLKEFGADINTVRKWLRKDMNRLFLINELISKTEIVYDKIAITYTDNIVPDNVIASQVADELLQIDRVEASFAVFRISDSEIAVSSRSLGSFNVQLVMEQMGGGGHFTAAATRYKNVDVKHVIKKLKEILEVEFANEGEKMKIILLEEIKNKGDKNDIIEINSGYANFLIKNKQAIQATDEAIKALEEKIQAKREAENKKKELLEKLANEINEKSVTVKIQTGNDGKMFGSVTTKEIVEEFQKQNKIVIEKRKVKLSSDITGVGIYTASIDLSSSIKATFQVNVVEK